MCFCWWSHKIQFFFILPEEVNIFFSPMSFVIPTSKRRMDWLFFVWNVLGILGCAFYSICLKSIMPSSAIQVKKKNFKFSFQAFWWSKIWVKVKMEEWIIYILSHDLEAGMYLQDEIMSYISKEAFALFYISHCSLAWLPLSMFFPVIITFKKELIYICFNCCISFWMFFFFMVLKVVENDNQLMK